VGREHLVVVLPGIGGSVLADPADHEKKVWAAGFGDVGNVLRRPERLSLGEHEHLEPVGVIRTRKAFGVWTAIPGYDGLLRRLGTLHGAVVDDGSLAGRNLDATVVAVPYDFRRSIVEAAQRLDTQVRARLARLWPDEVKAIGEAVRPRVVIVAHSMGGLIARYWLAQPENWPLCRALITLGTPHRGAPKALDILANGVAAGPFRIRRPVPVLRDWPGVAELLPRYPAVLDTSVAGGRVLRRPHELDLAWLRGPAKAAWAVHQEIEKAWTAMPRCGPEVIPRIGYGHGTLRRCAFDGTRVKVTKIAPEVESAGDGLGQWGDDLGDGTVPAYSGLPLEMDHNSPVGLRVQQRHGPIADIEAIPGLVESFEGRPPRSPIRGKERPVVLGLDVDEVAVAGGTVGVTARIAGTGADVGGVTVWASLAGPEAAPVNVRLDWNTQTGEFRGELSAPEPGLTHVTVSAEAVPNGGDPSSSAWLEVLDGDQLD
jgi:hypothetical protein